MSDNSSNENKSQTDSISNQLSELGKNLREALQSAWQSEERKKVQQDIEEGLSSLRASLNQAAQEFSNSSTGKTITEDVKDFQKRWQSGEVGSKARTEIVDALKKVNEELQKATKKNSPPPQE